MSRNYDITRSSAELETQFYRIALSSSRSSAMTSAITSEKGKNGLYPSEMTVRDEHLSIVCF